MGRKSTRKPRSNKKEKILLDTSEKILASSPEKVLDPSEKVILDSSENVSLDSDCDGDTPAKEFSEEDTEREVVTISDDENEIDSLLEEFMKEEAKVIHKSISKVILSSDDDDMEILLEEFTKDSSGDEKASSEVKKRDCKTKKRATKNK